MTLAGAFRRSSATTALAVLLAAAAASSARAQAITEFPVPTAGAQPFSIVAGPDGALWFTEFNAGKIGRISTAGAISETTLSTAASQPFSITAGPDGALWFTEVAGNNIGRITTAGAVTEIPIPPTNGIAPNPGGIALGPDGAFWFTEIGGNRIGRITLAGAITGFPIPTPNSATHRIVAGADGALWFAETAGNRIGRITTAGTITEFVVPTADAQPFDITAGPDGALWFTEFNGNKIGRIATDGTFTEFPVPTSVSQPGLLAVGPDGALWFSEVNVNKIGRITTSGVITEVTIPTVSSAPQGVAAGPDGAIWFAERSGNNVGRLSPPPAPTALLASVLPSSRSVQVPAVATVFASVINNTQAVATGCGIAAVTSLPATFAFQTTDPTTNLLTGTANTRVSIPPGGVQTFLLAFAPSAPQMSANVQIGYDCAGLEPAAALVGINTVLLTFDANPVPDMIAIGDTSSHDGFARIPGPTGTGFLVTAAINIGAAAALTARVRPQDSTAPYNPAQPAGSAIILSVNICESFPSGPQAGQCKAAATPTVTRTFNNNETSTFTVFLTGSGQALPPIPQTNRIIFEFVDAGGGNVRGSTSTAVTTQ